MLSDELIERASADVHAAWVETKKQQGVTSRPSSDGVEQMVPYEELPDHLKELDRATVRAVLNSPSVREALAGSSEVVAKQVLKDILSDCEEVNGIGYTTVEGKRCVKVNVTSMTERVRALPSTVSGIDVVVVDTGHGTAQEDQPLTIAHAEYEKTLDTKKLRLHLLSVHGVYYALQLTEDEAIEEHHHEHHSRSRGSRGHLYNSWHWNTEKALHALREGYGVESALAKRELDEFIKN